jgi:hypothetical protein
MANEPTAMAAWSANVSTSAICLSVKVRTVLLVTMIILIGVPSRSNGTSNMVRKSAILCA